MSIETIDETIYRGTTFDGFVRSQNRARQASGNLVQQTIRIVKTVGLLQHQLNSLYWHAARNNELELYTQCRIAIAAQFEHLLLRTKT